MATEGISWNETMDIMKDLTQLYSADNSHVVSAQVCSKARGERGGYCLC